MMSRHEQEALKEKYYGEAIRFMKSLGFMLQKVIHPVEKKTRIYHAVMGITIIKTCKFCKF